MPHPNQPVIVRHPEAGVLVALDPGFDYDPADPLVQTYPWAFTPIVSHGIVESVPIEQATAAPGEKRRGPGRPRKVAE